MQQKQLLVSSPYQERQRAGGRRQKGKLKTCPLLRRLGSKGLRPRNKIENLVACFQEGFESYK